ncbi:hypothetical protein HDU67_008799 [Dinochytrium kinnereticum]|nr:hypothetical protein HDU67_008799 [Dinochytrium kinnereticum]
MKVLTIFGSITGGIAFFLSLALLLNIDILWITRNKPPTSRDRSTMAKYSALGSALGMCILTITLMVSTILGNDLKDERIWSFTNFEKLGLIMRVDEGFAFSVVAWCVGILSTVALLVRYKTVEAAVLSPDVEPSSLQSPKERA